MIENTLITNTLLMILYLCFIIRMIFWSNRCIISNIQVVIRCIIFFRTVLLHFYRPPQNCFSFTRYRYVYLHYIVTKFVILPHNVPPTLNVILFAFDRNNTASLTIHHYSNHHCLYINAPRRLYYLHVSRHDQNNDRYTKTK